MLIVSRLGPFAAALLLGLGLSNAAIAQIGMARMQVADIAVTLLYPTDSPGVVIQSSGFELNVATNAAPSAGVRRLVVLSHGTGGSATSDFDAAASLVRAGFVVAQPLHVGDNYASTKDAGPISFERRPREISQVIDALSADPKWAARLKLDKVGVHGMSAGGISALSLAGAQWSMASMIRHCLSNGEADMGFCYQGAAAPDKRAMRQAQYEGVRNVPNTELPEAMQRMNGGVSPTEAQRNDAKFDPRPDARIAAISLAVPVAAMYSPASIARIRIPVAVVAAQLDTVLMPQFHSDYVLTHCKTCTLLANLPGAGHFDLVAPWPKAIAQRVAAGQPRGGLPEPNFDAGFRTAAFDRVGEFFRFHLTQ